MGILSFLKKVKLFRDAEMIPINEKNIVDTRIHYNVNGYPVMVEKNYLINAVPRKYTRDITPVDSDIIADSVEIIGNWVLV